MSEPTLLLSEQFYSIQGESTQAGQPCFFIRLAGCNLRCHYCDTRYAWEKKGETVTVAAIMREVAKHPGVLVTVTGGEPLLQAAVYSLFSALIVEGRQVQVETNGTVSLAQLPVEVAAILDIKCPSSGGKSLIDWTNMACLWARRKQGAQDEVKFVVASPGDFFWAKKTAEQHLEGFGPILVSPVVAKIGAAAVAVLILEEWPMARLQLQWHKLLWPEAVAGR